MQATPAIVTFFLSRSRSIGALVASGLIALSAPIAASANDLYSFLGALTLPNQASLGGTVIGGLSGIAYDDASKSWLLISDDKTEHGPPRFYSAQARLRNGFLSSIRFTGVTTLSEKESSPAAKNDKDPLVSKRPFLDAEGIAFTGKTILWTSEGNWKARAQNTLNEATLQGTPVRSYKLPDDLSIDFDKQTGPRSNAGLEAVAVTPDHATIWLGMEGPLTQDAALPDEEKGAPVRLTKIDRSSGTVEAQLVYPLEHRAAAALPGKHADGPGLDELDAVDGTHLLAMERSWVEGLTNFVQIYLVDTAGATDVRNVRSLKGASYKPVSKRLLIDLNKVGIQMDNYEGMALGPTLADGRRLLLVCVDNNFNKEEKTIIAAFAVDIEAALKQ